MKLVSALIPTCNRANLCVKAIKSVLSQTYFSIEIIVTDNSDTDELDNLIKQIGDERVRYFKNEKNIGPIPNWRRALDLAQGSYCFILPDDDFLINPFYIEEAVRILEATGASLLIPDCILSYPDRVKLGTSGYSGLINGQEFIRRGYHIPHIGNIFSRDLALWCNAFLEDEVLWSDIELWWKIMSHSDVYCYAIPCVLYLFHNKNIVFNMSRAQLIKNSCFIRSSVEKFADDQLVSVLLIRYLCMIDSYSGLVDKEFIRSTVRLNKIENKKRIYIVFYLRVLLKRIFKMARKFRKLLK